MKKEITIGENSFTIKRLKMRQVKGLLNEGSEKIQALYSIFDNGKEDIVTPLIKFVTENLDWAVGLAASQTEQETQMLEELDIIEFIELCSEIVKFNIPAAGLEKIKAFLEPPQPINQTEQAGEAEAALASMNFGETLPMVAEA